MTTNMKVAAAALMGLVAGMGGSIVGMTRRMLMRMANGPVVRWGYSKFPKQTVKQNQRAAAKAKNRAKHRAACRS